LTVNVEGRKSRTGRGKNLAGIPKPGTYSSKYLKVLETKREGTVYKFPLGLFRVSWFKTGPLKMRVPRK